jgi:hypothetical protein
MIRKSICSRLRTSATPAVDEVVEKARAEAGVERILVVYEPNSARVYVEKGEKKGGGPPLQRGRGAGWR